MWLMLECLHICVTRDWGRPGTGVSHTAGSYLSSELPHNHVFRWILGRKVQKSFKGVVNYPCWGRSREFVISLSLRRTFRFKSDSFERPAHSRWQGIVSLVSTGYSFSSLNFHCSSSNHFTLYWVSICDMWGLGTYLFPLDGRIMPFLILISPPVPAVKHRKCLI